MTSHTVGGATTTMAVNAADQFCWTYAGTTSNTCSTAPAGATTYTYDGAGNRTGSSAGFAATYNALGQTTSITPAGGSATPMTYAGDGQDTRLTAGTTGYVNTSTGVATSTTGSTATAFVTEPDGHLISLTAGAATYNYLYDAQGNVTGLTDTAGSQQATYSYDPFGGTTATGAAAALNPFRFAGGYQDATGLYHYGARYYDPATARWTQTDPSSQDAAYTYASNNPINASDPTGLVTWWQWGLIELAGWALSAAAVAAACAAMAALCFLWRMAIGGIVGALKAGLIGLIDHYSRARMVSAMVEGFLGGMAFGAISKTLQRIGLRIVSIVGIKRLIQAGIVGLVSLVTARGSAAMRR